MIIGAADGSGTASLFATYDEMIAPYDMTADGNTLLAAERLSGGAGVDVVTIPMDQSSLVHPLLDERARETLKPAQPPSSSWSRTGSKK